MSADPRDRIYTISRDATVAVHEVVELERVPCRLTRLGLQLAEANELLRQVREAVIEEQV